MMRLENELDERAKLKACVIGVGFAGSYNAQQIHKNLNIPAFIINSSVKDLSGGVIDKEIPSFIIGGDGRGAGNDRQKSKEMFKHNGRNLLEKTETFIRMITTSDIVYVAFSTAGGTGSGTGPDLVRLLMKMYPQKVIIPLVIAPKTVDSSLSQYNNLECINELDALECPYVIGDLDRFRNDSDNVAYEKMSAWTVENARELSGMELSISDSGMMDENDLTNVISAKGYLARYTVKVNSNDLERHDIQDMLLEEMQKSPAMTIQKDKHVSWGGLIVNLPAEIDDPIRSGDLSKIIQAVGEPKHFYKNYSVSSSTKGSVTIILSGMSLPYNRLSQCTSKVKDYIKATQESQRNISLSADLAELGGNLFGGFSTKSAQEPNEGVATALDDFFS